MPKKVSDELKIELKARGAWDMDGLVSYVKEHVTSPGTYHFTFEEIMEFHSGSDIKYKDYYSKVKLVEACDRAGIEVKAAASSKKDGIVAIAVKKVPKSS
jgi:hypothetical protein